MMGLEILKITDVKTKTDVHKICAQKCVFGAYNSAIAIFVLGILASSLTVNKIKFRRHVPNEYKMLVGVFLSVGTSYGTAVYYKNICQRRIINELEQMNLGHLVKGIKL